MMFLSTFFTESSPSTFLSSSNEMRLFPDRDILFSPTVQPERYLKACKGDTKKRWILQNEGGIETR
jgi:hypothetical protein